jgi:putative ABC transport system permease protein
VNETFARMWWPTGSAVGSYIKVGGPYIDGPLIEVVGVVADVKQDGLDSKPLPEIYQPFAQKPSGAMAVIVRATGDPEALIPSVRRAVSGVDRNLPIQGLAGLERTLGASLARRRFSTLLLSGFAGLAIILAIVGIYGLLSYWVSVREREIGIRLALGARPSVIVRWTSLQALRLAGIGMVFGVAGAWAAARGLEDLVFGIPPRSPATMAASAVAVTLIAGLAAAIPSWRAARVDAASQLHQ